MRFIRGRMKSYREIVRVVWPLALGMINNAVMQFVDRAYLAHYSMPSLEAVLPSGMLMWIFTGFFQAVVGYSAVFVGQYHGAGEEGKCRGSCLAAFYLSIASGILALPLVPFGNWILAQTATSSVVCSLERSYFDIMLLGTFFICGQTAAASYFTGRGRTRLVFWVNLLGNVLNVALDPLFIFVFDLGISGAAYATLISMTVQFVVLAACVWREFAVSTYSLSAREHIVPMLRYGIPAGGYTILNMLSFTVFVFITGGVGELELAVSNACFTVNYLIAAPVEGFSLGASTLVAQAIGAGDTRGAEIVARRTLVIGVGSVAVLSAFVLAFSHPILSLFAAGAGEASADFHSLGFTLLSLMAAWLIFDACDVILSGALKGAGDTRFVMFWMLFCAFALWLPVVFIVRNVCNTMPALWTTMIGYLVVICIGSVLRWRFGPWRRLRII